jgi:hypothetical protein
MDGDAHVSSGARSGGNALPIRMQDLRASISFTVGRCLRALLSLSHMISVGDEVNR